MSTIGRRHLIVAAVMGCSHLINSRYPALSQERTPLPRSCALTGSISEYEGRLYRTSGDQKLDSQLAAELNRAASVFLVRPGFGIVDDASQPNAWASPDARIEGTTGTILLGRELLFIELRSNRWGGTAVAGIIAHEFAHIYQFLFSIYGQLQEGQTTDRLAELHADYMAGFYLGIKRLLAPLDIKAFADALYKRGDTAFEDPTHHGKPEERVQVMIEGYRRGLQGEESVHQIAHSGEELVRKI